VSQAARRARHGATLAAVVPLAALAAFGAGARSARAQAVIELVPTVGIGATTNAAANLTQTQGAADEFLTYSGVVRLRYAARRSTHALGYRLTGTQYLHRNGPTGLSHEVSWASTFNLTGRLDLDLGASGAYAHTTRLGPLDPMTNIAGGQIDSQYVSAGVIQQLVYQPNLRRRLVEALHFGTVRYLAPGLTAAGVEPPRIPSTVNVGTMLRSEWVRARDTWSLQLDASESFVQNAAVGLPPQTVLAQLLGGWGRALSPTVSVLLQVGAEGAFDLHGNGVIGPAGIASVDYKRVSWYATASVGQQLSPNLFLGQATVNDQALARATLPLTRSELFYVIGFAGYTYARLASSATSQKAYDLRAAGLSLTARSHWLPLWTSLDYTINDQHGNFIEGGNIPDRQWQSIMLTVGGAFAFGPGAEAPVFHGVN
jgi:hypothetical protein